MFLLTDEEVETVNSYADAIHNRETVMPIQVPPGSQTDGTYFGCGCRFTDLERNHFYHSDFYNVTPGRPCMAYFTSSYFVDSQAVFDKLVESDIARESVTCLQRRPLHDMVITFVDVETKINLLVMLLFVFATPLGSLMMKIALDVFKHL